MNLENVRYLLTALDTGSFSAAAAHFNLTPSGLNRQISALERELGTVLLLRSRRGVLPAQGAEPIITRLRDVVAAEERGQEEITAAKGLITGHLSIGFYYSIAANFLPPLLKTFSSTYPAIRLSVTEGTDSELIEALQAGKLDCAFLSQHSYDGDFFPLFDTEFVVWLPTDHPLTARSSIRAEDLADQPFVYPRAHHRSDIDDFLARHKITPAVRIDTNDPYSAYAMVAAGLGVSVNNRLQTAGLKERLVLKPLDPPESVTLGIAGPSIAAASPALIRLLSLAQQIARQNDESSCTASSARTCSKAGT